MRRIHRILLILFLFLCLSVQISGVDSSISGSLEGKNLLLLGDSYSAHHKLQLEEGWPYQVCEAFGMELYDYAISGSSFAGGDNGRYPMVDRYASAMEEDYDIIILQGGSNDWSHNIPLGDVESRDKTTMLGAMNLMLDDFEAAWPEATIICFTPWVSTGAKNSLGLDTDDYVDAIARLCQSRDLILYDASNASENGIYMNQESFRTQYSLTSTDRWHLNAKGQSLFAAAFGRWIQQELLGICTADRFLDMAAATPELREAVSLIYDKGIMNGISDTLFAPTQGATRGALAVTLYRLAGSPSVQNATFGDVASDSSLLPALSWAMDQGILTPDQGNMSPSALLHRQELVTALYAYYTKVQRGNVTELMGLGQYTDLEQIPGEDRNAWGWFLAEDFISLSYKLQPDALVSRGQLALVLSNFLK